MTARYANLKARKNALDKTAIDNTHMMMQSVLRLAKTAAMASRK
tara:strand:+ start:68520 stop:68651 length:132 start_codon:yes stop_codon:yes gene_type:complete